MNIIKPLKIGLFILGISCSLPTEASTKSLFQQGNQAMKKRAYAQAITAYEKASNANPDSPEILYNLGNAHYRAGHYALATTYYEAAADNAPPFQEKAWYNMGNCLLQISTQQTDPNQALRLTQQAIQLYRQALLNQPNFPNAIHNMNLAQSLLTNLQKKAKQQNEQQQKNQNLIEEIRKTLLHLIQQQTNLLQQKEKNRAQQPILIQTQKLIKKMKASGLCIDFTQLDSPIPAPLKTTLKHTQNASDAMQNQKHAQALGELQAALQALPTNPNQNDDETQDNPDEEESDTNPDTYKDGKPKGNFAEYDELRGLPPPERSEKEILAEEIRNNQRRKKNRSGKYKAPDKDW